MTTHWGIAATGGMAAAFATDLALVPDAGLAFVGSRSPDTAAAFAGRFGAAGAGTHRDLIEAGRRGEVDVVYVATPHPQHHALALAAIEAGIPLLVEKAFTATLAGAEEVVAAARATGVRVLNVVHSSTGASAIVMPSWPSASSSTHITSRVSASGITGLSVSSSARHRCTSTT